ncbi:MAG TPA: KH domain-containing protein [Patescibacteria group bacterium]|nr:KH domain-containing protein [Patescibacteria group bacterium]
MIRITLDKVQEIKKNKKKLEKELKISIEIQGQDIILEGEGENEYIAEKVIDALDFGFSINKALKIKKEDSIFEILDIKSYTRQKNFQRVKGRIIGVGGKVIKTLSDLTGCDFEINNNKLGVIGSPELIKNAQTAVISLIQGSKQANVYAYLERHRVKPVFDLGLKETKRSKKAKE